LEWAKTQTKIICMLIKPQSRSIRPRVAFISFDQFSIKLEIKIFDNIFTEIDYTNIIWSDKVVGVGQYNDNISNDIR
jgi:hypothetical protein